MIPLLFLAAAVVSDPALDGERYGLCVAAIRENPADGEKAANAWQLAGGGAKARQCLGLAYVAEEKYPAAATAFAAAARAAELAHDTNVADLWGQAGNAALLANDFASAETWLGTALAGSPAGPKRGELLIDRARALVALGKPIPARADLDAAIRLAPNDSDAWLLSATLARRDKQLNRAETDIAEAAKRAPNDPDVLVEQGNIAGLAGHVDEAKAHWRAAIKLAPQSEAGVRAAKALAANGS